jgi:tetratricopeptide (TPR) repeat protein
MIRSRTIIFIAFVLLGLASATFAQATADQRPLEPGPALARELAAGQMHSYTLQLSTNQFARVLVEQQNCDVVLTVRAADGKQLAASDNPNPNGLESLSWIAAAAGSYQVQIRAAQPTATGKYDIRLEELRVATTADKDRLTAEQLFLEAERLSLSDKPRALEKYEAALQLRRTLGDQFDEAVLLHALGKLWAASNSPDKAAEAYRQALGLFQSTSGQGWDTLFANMSFLYTVMGSKQKTLDYLAEALPLVRALRNRRLEAVLLVGLAKIHSDLNQTEQALERQQQALHLYRASGGRAGETITMTNIGDADLTLEQRQKAIQYLQQSLLVMRAVGDKSLEATVLFGIARQIEPRPRPAFAVMRTGEQTVYGFFISDGCSVGEKVIRFLQRRRQPCQIERNAPQQGQLVGFRRRLQPFLFQPRQHETIYRVTRPAFAFDGGQRRLHWLHIRPMFGQLCRLRFEV